MVLLDYVANRDLRLPREGSSNRALWAQLRIAAKSGESAAAVPDESQLVITDDHTPFLRAGIPAIDLIDWSYPGHDAGDTLDQLSLASIDAVGETLIELVRRIDRGALAGLRKPDQ